MVFPNMIFSEKERQTDRQTDRDRQRETDRDRDRQRQTERVQWTKQGNKGNMKRKA